ncbi:MAG TPA: NADH-quinone oxidoreductase subunit NuoH [Anaerolineae bacterium]|nr:NADH-quinone oxidoreductase subunit NuoH [Anaerolineae bacterium]HNU04305.1 NADH-quinone oxidoreductase subunit NuoH [Anaerolineae bacterium]
MDWISLIVVPAIKSLVLIIVLLTSFAYLTYYERKMLARFHVRYGPNRAGPLGLLQPIADAFKAIFKEEIIPLRADKLIYLAAPVLALIPALVAYAVIPIGPTISLFGQQVNLYIADVNVGFLYILAVAGLGAYGVILAGWSSNNNYSTLGALRTSAQMVSYELPLGIMLVSIVLTTTLATGTGSLSLVELVQSPRPWWVWLWLWIGFPIFFICMLAETNRSPFDLPETENELVAGFQTEYGGIKFALFFMAEYINMIVASGIMVTVFFGGYRGPFVDQVPILGVLYFVLKVILVLFLFLWVRASVPRVRYDQLMAFNWKFLLPTSLLYLAITAVAVALV